AVLQIPEIGVRDLVVVEGTSPSQLENGPGHRRDTPLPGQAGVSVVMGRSLLFGGPFADLLELRGGSDIVVTTGEGAFHYTVHGSRTEGGEQPADLLPGAARLTLISSRRVGSWLDASVEAVYVDATLSGPATPAPGGRPTVIDHSETTMQGDAGALGEVALWL